jgi:hypothetical protein
MAFFTTAAGASYATSVQVPPVAVANACLMEPPYAKMELRFVATTVATPSRHFTGPQHLLGRRRLALRVSPPHGSSEQLVHNIFCVTAQSVEAPQRRLLRPVALRTVAAELLKPPPRPGGLLFAEVNMQVVTPKQKNQLPKEHLASRLPVQMLRFFFFLFLQSQANCLIHCSSTS